MPTATELERGMCFVYNNQVLRVTRKEVVNCGTHSHTKLKLFVEDAFKGGGEKTINLSHNDGVEIVNVQKKKGQLIALNGSAAQVMDSVSYETFDATLANEELKNELKENDIVIFVEYQGRVVVLGKFK